MILLGDDYIQAALDSSGSATSGPATPDAPGDQRGFQRLSGAAVSPTSDHPTARFPCSRREDPSQADHELLHFRNPHSNDLKLNYTFSTEFRFFCRYEELGLLCSALPNECIVLESSNNFSERQQNF
ncbi:hypothetical protein SDJN03_15719, partial [Cucurbita argyrosperma subsp. sororia]